MPTYSNVALGRLAQDKAGVQRLLFPGRILSSSVPTPSLKALSPPNLFPT